MARYKMIVFLGPGYPYFDRVFADPEFQDWRKSRGIKIIGDGRSDIDYEGAIAALVEREAIGPDTLIYAQAHGSVENQTHYMRFAAGPKVSSMEFLNTLQSAVVAYKKEVPVPWTGSVVISSCYSGQILNEPGASALTRVLAVGADSDKTSVIRPGPGRGAAAYAGRSVGAHRGGRAGV